MKRYLLLRNNQEMGPFTLEDLNEIGLKSNDLIWVEGESIRWSLPNQIQDQNTLTKPQPDGAEKDVSTDFINCSESDVKDHLYFPNFDQSFPKSKNEEPDQEPGISDADEINANPPVLHHRKALLTSYGAWITILFVLLAGTVWMLKIALEVYQGKRILTSNLTPAVAPLKILPEGVSPSREEDVVYQNALSREIVPVDTILEKEPVKKAPSFKE